MRRWGPLLLLAGLAGCAALDRERYSLVIRKPAHRYGPPPPPAPALPPDRVATENDLEPFRPFAWCRLHETSHPAESTIAVGAAPVEYPAALAANVTAIAVGGLVQQAGRLVALLFPDPRSPDPSDVPDPPTRGADRPGTDDHPLPPERRKEMARRLDEAIAAFGRRLEENPRHTESLSRRGDALFFRGRFTEAVKDYEAMIEVNPEVKASHWRLGIAYFYAGDYGKAVRQFEAYHSFDNVDRENGIWRFLSQVKAGGPDKAKEELLRYEKDDREPFPAVYALFSGDTTPERILAGIGDADLADREREKRRFYANLYIGLHHAVHDRPEEARRHLRSAVANTWGPDAGFGPRYMWHVGRLHYERLAARTR